ncbi:MAG: ATP-dependent RecD-like DNA helicase, partial [Deltaproteobacteria bacterium]|nr:ATP-dependent RecD-like DNA helicase [Deltaproteobacteria bacterium]
QAERWEKVDPVTLEGIERYLGSGLIKGIGPTYARRLVAGFGLGTLKVLSEEPHRLLEVPGIGRIRARRILDTWEQHKEMREAMLFLRGHGVSSSLALKIYRAFGPETVRRVKENPYGLAREIHGVGFVLADRIAGSVGVASDSAFRAQAGLLHVLARFTDGGHCFVPADLLAKQACSLLGIEDQALLQSAMAGLAAEGEVVVEKDAARDAPRVYLRKLYEAESRVASALHKLLTTPSALTGARGSGFLQATRPQLDLWLEAEQRQALSQTLASKVLVITGGPGTGKTTIVTALLKLLRQAKVSFALAAPTGRAAKRMEETTGEEAKTLHRLLEYNPRESRFQRGESDPLSARVVIVDEASMVDLPLMDHLLGAIESHGHLVLIGDVDQLPSVGPGSVLRDLIDSGTLPVVVLRRVFRQGAESLIVANAHRILQGQPLTFEVRGGKRDFMFIARETEAEVLEAIESLLGGPNPLPFKPDAVQVLSPMHRGLLGTSHLNRRLQNLLNPGGASLERGEPPFRLGDKVMQLRNNYDKGVFNGDLGRIAGMDREREEVVVEFYDRTVSYGLDELDEIALAYAISIHKSQGSEYSAVIIPFHTSHFPMLQRNVLYTALTRAKELVALVGSRKAVAMAIRNVRIERRFTGLKDKLRALCAPG